MGAARRRSERFFESHPICCFCGGEKPATTIDHVPSRACFPAKAGPEGFEFPACATCQDLYRQEEHYFALVCRISDQDNENYDQETSSRLISGVKNNAPELLPHTRLTANQKRRVLRSLGIDRPPNTSLRELPLAAFPVGSDPALKKVIIKLGLALFYRHKGRPASDRHLCAAYWTQSADLRSMQRWKEFAGEFTGVVWGARKNLKFGNRFRYGWAAEETGQPDIFMVIAEFGKGLVVCALIWDEIYDPELDFGGEKISVNSFSRKQYPDDWPRK